MKVIDLLNKIANKEEIEKVLEELNQVEPSHLNNKALRLFNAIMSIADERDLLQQENKQLKNRIENAIVTLNNIYLLDNVTITNNACNEIDKAIEELRWNNE